MREIPFRPALDRVGSHGRLHQAEPGLPFKFVVEVKVRLAYFATVEPYAAEKIGHFYNPIRNTCLSAAL